MGEQLNKINLSVEFIREKYSKKFSTDTALIINRDCNFTKEFVKVCDLSEIPSFDKDDIFKNRGSLICAKFGKKDVLIMKGRYNYYNGISMRDIGHIIYAFKLLGIKKILSIDEAGYLNPRFKGGELAIVYDHINLMGYNPLIGKNENELGLRFPDMSNAYDKDLVDKISDIFREKKMKVNEAVYIGVPGPAGETEAETRFYREIGADVVGYSMVPENITAVHAGIDFAGIALLTRELIADKMMEDERTESQIENERKRNFKKAEENLGKVLKEVLYNL